MSENAPIQYSMPGDTEYLDATESEGKLKEVMAAAGADVNHPYTNGNHVMHRDYVDYVHRLHEIVAAGREDPADKLQREAREWMEQKQEKLDKEGELIRDRLVRDYNFEPVELEGDTTQSMIDAWKMQEECARGEYLRLASEMENECRKLGILRESAHEIDALRDLDMSDDYRETTGQRLIERVYETKKQKGI